MASVVRRCVLLAAFTCVWAVAVPAYAVLSWSMPGAAGSANYSSVSSVDGMEFTPTQNISVTALGWYDDTFMTSPGLAISHQVGIWRLSDSQLLIQTSVGPSSTALNRFRFENVNSTNLSAGVTYVIAGLGGTSVDPNTLVTPGSTLSVDSGITMGNWRAGASTFGFPTSIIPASTRLLGPAFQFVPEPGSILLLLAGGVVAFRRRR
jgi:hypothetical protein